MSLVTTPAYGPFVNTWGGTTMGLNEGPYVINKQAHARDVRAQQHGDSVIEGIYAGGECFVTCTPKEWNTVALDAMWPFDANFGEIGSVGRLMTDIGKALVLTPVAGTTAAANGYTWTFNKAIIAPEHTLEIIKGCEEHNVPIVMKAYPYLNGSSKPVFFTTA